MSSDDRRHRTAVAKLVAAGTVLLAPVLWAVKSTDLTVFVIAYWIIAGVFIARFLRRVGGDVLAPAIAWPAILFLYMVAPAINALVPGRLPLDFEVPAGALRTYYVCGIAGLIGFGVGTLVAIRRHRWASRPLPDHSSLMAKVAGIAALVIAPFAFRSEFFVVQSYAERAMDLRLERMASNASGIFEAIVAAATTLFLASATWLVFRHRSYAIRCAAALLLTWYMSINTLAGWRGVVVAALCIPIAFYHYRIRQAGAIAAAGIAIAIYLFMATLSVVRTTADPAEMARTLRDQFRDEGLSFAQLESMTELQVGGNLIRLIIGVDERETQFTMGRSILSELAVYVPRAVFPNRPLSMSETYMEVFYPGARQQGEGRGLFILAEGYWALGVVGVFAFMVVFGWSLEIVYEKLILNSRNDFGALCYGVVFYTLVVETVRSGVLLSYKVALIRTLPFLVIIAGAHMARAVAGKHDLQPLRSNVSVAPRRHFSTR